MKHATLAIILHRITHGQTFTIELKKITERIASFKPAMRGAILLKTVKEEELLKLTLILPDEA